MTHRIVEIAPEVGASVRGLARPFLEREPHTVPAIEVARQLDVTVDTGLASTEVDARRHRYGLNRLPEAQPRPAWKQLLDQFRDFMILVLLAAALLSREGIPTTLVRAGKDYCPLLGSDEKWARRVSVDLGYVRHVDIPPLLGLADFLIQPGTDDAFNEYRLPAKLPEFFAMGRPVLLPLTNVGRFVRHGHDAWVLPKVDAVGIVDALKTFRAAEELQARLSAGALAFCDEHFDWSKNTATLENFYEQIRLTRTEGAHASSIVS